MGKKITLFPDDNLQKGPHDFTHDIQFPLLYVIMIPNTIGTIAKAICHNDYSLVVFAISGSYCMFLSVTILLVKATSFKVVYQFRFFLFENGDESLHDCVVV
ncbi:hypothetical protein Tco_0982013 [Tanacetum coccineum]